MPEDGFNFGKIGLGEIGAGVYWAVVYAADFQGEGVCLRGYQEVCAQAAEFVGEAIAYVE